ncbi:MAG: rrf2 family protein [Deltaproteobacteria bacterium]|nr:rrf2 family protein [Deltaproteobacteria bacterium]
MKLSTKIRYGARAMLVLASRYGKGPLELHEIAKKENISLKYLEQVIIPLRTAGLVKSVRGARGGYSLGKPPAEICLKDLVEILEGPLTLVDCLGDPRRCERSAACVTREIWSEVSEAIYDIFHSITLEDMVQRQKEKEGMVAPMYEI